jgi:hypothetical protein
MHERHCTVFWADVEFPLRDAILMFDIEIEGLQPEWNIQTGKEM